MTLCFGSARDAGMCLAVAFCAIVPVCHAGAHTPQDNEIEIEVWTQIDVQKPRVSWTHDKHAARDLPPPVMTLDVKQGKIVPGQQPFRVYGNSPMTMKVDSAPVLVREGASDQIPLIVDVQLEQAGKTSLVPGTAVTIVSSEQVSSSFLESGRTGLLFIGAQRAEVDQHMAGHYKGTVSLTFDAAETDSR